MEKIRLETEHGNLVALEAIPGFNKPPRVIMWCGRTFCLSIYKPGVAKWAPGTPGCAGQITSYREAFMLEIPSPEFLAREFGNSHTEVKS